MMIGVVILNYNSYEDTIELVKRLQKQTLVEDLTIVVVDNCSSNNSFSKLECLGEFYSNTFVIKTESNLGYANGNNFGLNYLDRTTKPDYVAVLNNDVVLDDDCFEKLLEKYAVLDNPGIIAPMQLDLDGQICIPNRLNSYLDDCLSLFYISKIFHKRKAYKIKDNTGYNALCVDMIPGSFMFTRFETFKEMGFFYPNTFLFAEERFIAMKARKLNLKNYILLDETYIHAHSKTINTLHSQISKYKLLYESWLEFTKVYRTYPKLRVWVLKSLMKMSIVEMKIFHKFKSILHKK